MSKTQFQVYSIDWQLDVLFSTSLPVSLIRQTNEKEEIEWHIPAGLLRGKLRETMSRILYTINDGSSVLCGFPDSPESTPELCRGASSESQCVICRIFGSQFHQSPIQVSNAALAPGQKVLTGYRTRGAVTLMQGVSLDPRQTLEVTQPGLLFVAHLTGNLLLTPEEFSLFKGSIRTINQLGRGSGYGLSFCALSLHGSNSISMKGNEQ